MSRSQVPKLFDGLNIVLEGYHHRSFPEFLRLEGATIGKKPGVKTDMLLRCGYPSARSVPVTAAKKLNKSGKANIQIEKADDLRARTIPDDARLAALLATDHARFGHNLVWTDVGHSNQLELSAVDGLVGKPVKAQNWRHLLLIDSSLARATLQDVTLGGLKDCDLKGASLKQVRLEAVERIDLRKAKVDGLEVIYRAESCQFDGAAFKLVPQEAVDCSFRKATVSTWSRHGGGYRYAMNRKGTPQYQNCRFDSARLAPPVQRNFENCGFDKAIFTGEEGLASCYFTGCSIKGADFSGQQLRGVDFSSCNLAKATFKGATLYGVTFDHCDLSGVDFSGATLHRVKVEKGKLSGLKIAGAELVGASAKVTGIAEVKGADQLAVRGDAGLRDLQRVLKKGGSVESTIRLRMPDGKESLASLWGSDYGASAQVSDDEEKVSRWGGNNFFDLTCAVLAAAAQREGATLLPDTLTNKSSGCRVKGTALKKIVLRAWYEALGEEAPSDEKIAEAAAAKRKTAAKKATATKKLRKELLALLEDGTAKGVKAWNARHAEVLEAGIFKGADFSGRKLVGIKMGAFPESDFSGADLSRAAFPNVSCAKADFSKATLAGAKFADTELKGANFKGADLSKAKFSVADLCGADFTAATLDGATFKGGIFDEKTILPKGFPVPQDLNWRGKGPDPTQLAAIEEEKKKSGPVDLLTFMDNIDANVDKSRLSKAAKMLKKDAFQLFVEASDDSLCGVVKSQSDAKLLYSCRLDSDGSFCCCTQNLNTCGGLRGALCKHLLVLIIGVANGGEVDTDDLDAWVAKSKIQKPELDKDAMSAVLLKYKGAEAGEIDWRPTETVPEDYYAL